MSQIYRARYSTKIPDQDILSFVFSTGDEKSRKTPQYFDAYNPLRNYSLEEGEKFAKQVGLGLKNLGLKPDDKVLLYSSNNLFFPVLLWGTIAAECVFTASSPSATSSELQYQLKDSGAKTLICGLDFVPTALDAAEAIGLPRNRVFVFCHPEDQIPLDSRKHLQLWTDIWASEEQASKWSWNKITDPKILANTTAILNYSSGTTGAPKGVEISHANVVANSSQLIYYRTLVADTSEARARDQRLKRSGERWLAPLPMYHAYGQMYYCVSGPRMGARVYIMPKYNITHVLLFLDIYRITLLTGVPVLLTQITKQQTARFNLNSLEYVLTGSAPMPGEISSVVEKDYLRGDLSVRQGWGMTETTSSMSGFCPDDESDHSSVGFLNPNCIAKIVPVEGQSWNDEDTDGNPVGELWVSGRNVMKGYYRRDEETKETIVYEDKNRWLRTGDVAFFDSKGRIHIVDRLKELIKVKGLQVAPAEVEAVIHEMPQVSDVAVVGAKMNDGEYPRAFVVRKDSNLSAKEISETVESKLARHKWLTGGVYFTDEIPRTSNGKVMKRRLPDPTNRQGKL